MLWIFHSAIKTMPRLNLAMYELTHGLLNYGNDSLESLIFNPIDQVRHNLSFNYLDPDINFPFNFLQAIIMEKGRLI